MMLDSRREGEGAVERDGCDLGEIISDKFLIKQGIPSMVSDDVAQLDLQELWRVGGICRDRKRGVLGKSVAERVVLGGGSIITKQNIQKLSMTQTINRYIYTP